MSPKERAKCERERALSMGTLTPEPAEIEFGDAIANLDPNEPSLILRNPLQTKQMSEKKEKTNFAVFITKNRPDKISNGQAA